MIPGTRRRYHLSPLFLRSRKNPQLFRCDFFYMFGGVKDPCGSAIWTSFTRYLIPKLQTNKIVAKLTVGNHELSHHVVLEWRISRR